VIVCGIRWVWRRVYGKGCRRVIVWGIKWEWTMVELKVRLGVWRRVIVWEMRWEWTRVVRCE